MTERERLYPDFRRCNLGSRFRRLVPHGQLAFVEHHLNPRPLGHVAGHQQAGDPRFDLALQKSLERPSAIDRIETCVGNVPPAISMPFRLVRPSTKTPGESAATQC